MPEGKFNTEIFQSADELLERVSQTAEVITSPESKTLVEFYDFVKKFFKPEEMEPLEVYQRELVNNNPNIHYILTVLRDPTQQNKLISAAYGSVQNGVLTGRFILTDSSYQLKGLRSTGVGQKVLDLLFTEAKRFSEEKNMKIRGFAGAAREKSESFYNRQEIEPGNGMKRIYLPETTPDETNHIHYEVPPLDWNKDGTPSQQGLSECLQIAVKGYPEKIPVTVLEEILRDWWAAGYIRPRDQFNDDEAWELHKKTVWDILEVKILAPMRRVSELKLISKKDRELSKEEMVSLSEEWAELSAVLCGPEFIRSLSDFFTKEKVQTILECACGDGHVLTGLAPTIVSGTGIDTDDYLIRRAIKNNKNKNIQYKKVNLLDLNEDPEIAKQDFDAVMCRGNSISNIGAWGTNKDTFDPEVCQKEIEQALKQMWAKLKPGGVLYLDVTKQEDIDKGDYQPEINAGGLNLRGVVTLDKKKKRRDVYGQGTVKGRPFKGGSSTYLITPRELTDLMVKLLEPKQIWTPTEIQDSAYQVICARK